MAYGKLRIKKKGSKNPRRLRRLTDINHTPDFDIVLMLISNQRSLTYLAAAASHCVGTRSAVNTNFFANRQCSGSRLSFLFSVKCLSQ